MNDFAGRVMSLSRFDQALKSIAVSSAAAEMGIASQEPGVPIDWNFALMCASALTDSNLETAQDAVLRVAQGVVRSTSTSLDQKAAAMLLLERVGNTLAMQLASDREHAAPLDYRAIPAELALDGLLRREELTIPTGGNSEMSVNPFQRQFWDLANSSDWLSVSAPTSAGKSHIVREWLRQEVLKHERIRLVYLAPTRALVEEVSETMRRQFPAAVGIYTMPWDAELSTFDRQVFVLTQERFHLLQQRSPDFTAEVIFIDEAQKISEGSRGILLSQVIDEAVSRSGETRLIFASPLVQNPEILVRDGGTTRVRRSLTGENVTVNQNLIFAKQVARKTSTYELTLSYRGEDFGMGHVELAHAPDGVGQRVALIAVALAGEAGGNLVYANGAAEAEKYAMQIYEALGVEAEHEDEGLADLIDFSKGVVHERFSLARVARRGVAFHYGDMPLVLKAKVEELFKSGSIKYLVCTSTLLEGVNLPCRNIFMRGPRKGPAKMSMADFWNLAGRAGRWGKEFQGNIICIDAHLSDVWPEKPGIRKRSLISPASDQVFNNSESLIRYMNSGGQITAGDTPAEVETVFSWISGRFLNGKELPEMFGVELPTRELAHVAESLRSSLGALELSPEIVKRHAGISPLSMQRLLDAVLEHGHPEQLALVPPVSDDAFVEYKVALDLVAQHLGGSFYPETRRLSLARLIVHWMRGVPLGTIIENRARWRRQQGEEVQYPKLIRKVMEDVEDIARFEAPRYLSCYADVVAFAASKIGIAMSSNGMDVEMMLELGVPRRTDMSFIAVGLSRATTRALAPYVLEANLTPEQCLSWLETAEPEILDVPAYALREMTRLRNLISMRAGI